MEKKKNDFLSLIFFAVIKILLLQSPYIIQIGVLYILETTTMIPIGGQEGSSISISVIGPLLLDNNTTITNKEEWMTQQQQQSTTNNTILVIVFVCTALITFVCT